MVRDARVSRQTKETKIEIELNLDGTGKADISTGIPFFLFQDTNKRNRNRADVIYFSEKSNYKIGDRLFELEVWRNHNKKNSFKSFIQNIYQFDITTLNESRIELFIQKLKTYKGRKNILGFPSSYEIICNYLNEKQSNQNKFNISSIIANAEYLNSYTKTEMGKHFSTVVLSRYSSEEIGIMAHQTINSPELFVINHASYHVEILNFNNDEPAPFGELGRIVVTDLFNYSMPIIRYDTGDAAKFIKTEDGIIKFESIEGRKMDLIYDTKGNIISSFVVYTKFYNYYKLLKQYQFIQESEKEYKIKLNIHNDFPFENELINNVKKDFGNDAIVKIEYVDEIPPLASGKRKKVVNNYKKM